MTEIEEKEAIDAAHNREVRRLKEKYAKWPDTQDLEFNVAFPQGHNLPGHEILIFGGYQNKDVFLIPPDRYSGKKIGNYPDHLVEEEFEDHIVFFMGSAGNKYTYLSIGSVKCPHFYEIVFDLDRVTDEKKALTWTDLSDKFADLKPLSMGTRGVYYDQSDVIVFTGGKHPVDCHAMTIVTLEKEGPHGVNQIPDVLRNEFYGHGMVPWIGKHIKDKGRWAEDDEDEEVSQVPFDPDYDDLDENEKEEEYDDPRLDIRDEFDPANDEMEPKFDVVDHIREIKKNGIGFIVFGGTPNLATIYVRYYFKTETFHALEMSPLPQKGAAFLYPSCAWLDKRNICLFGGLCFKPFIQLGTQEIKEVTDGSLTKQIRETGLRAYESVYIFRATKHIHVFQPHKDRWHIASAQCVLPTAGAWSCVMDEQLHVIGGAQEKNIVIEQTSDFKDKVASDFYGEEYFGNSYGVYHVSRLTRSSPQWAFRRWVYDTPQLIPYYDLFVEKGEDSIEKLSFMNEDWLKENIGMSDKGHLKIWLDKLDRDGIKQMRMLKPYVIAVAIESYKILRKKPGGENVQDLPGTRLDRVYMNGLFKKYDWTQIKGFKKRKVTKFQWNKMVDRAVRVLTTNEEDYNGLFVFIAGHGSEGTLMLSDGTMVNLRQFGVQFDGQHLKSMIDYPKLVFVNTCRGEAWGEVIGERGSARTEGRLRLLGRRRGLGGLDHRLFQEEALESNVDSNFLTIFATTKGTAVEDDEKGTALAIAMDFVLGRHHMGDQSFQHVMHKITLQNRVITGKIQAIETRSTMQGYVYFQERSPPDHDPLKKWVCLHCGKKHKKERTVIFECRDCKSSRKWRCQICDTISEFRTPYCPGCHADKHKHWPCKQARRRDAICGTLIHPLSEFCLTCFSSRNVWAHAEVHHINDGVIILGGYQDPCIYWAPLDKEFEPLEIARWPSKFKSDYFKNHKTFLIRETEKHVFTYLSIGGTTCPHLMEITYDGVFKTIKFKDLSNNFENGIVPGIRYGERAIYLQEQNWFVFSFQKYVTIFDANKPVDNLRKYVDVLPRLFRGHAMIRWDHPDVYSPVNEKTPFQGFGFVLIGGAKNDHTVEIQYSADKDSFKFFEKKRCPASRGLVWPACAQLDETQFGVLGGSYDLDEDEVRESIMVFDVVKNTWRKSNVQMADRTWGSSLSLSKTGYLTVIGGWLKGGFKSSVVAWFSAQELIGKTFVDQLICQRHPYPLPEGDAKIPSKEQILEYFPSIPKYDLKGVSLTDFSKAIWLAKYISLKESHKKMSLELLGLKREYDGLRKNRGNIGGDKGDLMDEVNRLIDEMESKEEE